MFSQPREHFALGRVGRQIADYRGLGGIRMQLFKGSLIVPYGKPYQPVPASLKSNQATAIFKFGHCGSKQASTQRRSNERGRQLRRPFIFRREQN